MRWASNSLTVVRYVSGNYGVVVPRNDGFIRNEHYLYLAEEVEHVTCTCDAEQATDNSALPR
jgi:hypothetical protein